MLAEHLFAIPRRHLLCREFPDCHLDAESLERVKNCPQALTYKGRLIAQLQRLRCPAQCEARLAQIARIFYAAATTAAYRAGNQPHLASALLQHTDPRVTQEHYNRASTMTAALDFARLVRKQS